MAIPKLFFLTLVTLMAVLILFSSEVSAAPEVEKNTDVNTESWGHGGYGHGGNHGGGGYGHGGGYHGGGGYGHGGGYHRGGGYGHGGGYHHGMEEEHQ